MKLSLNNIAYVLMLAAVASTLYIYYPILRAEMMFRVQSSQPVGEPKSSEFGIVIDRLGINETITANVDPFNSREYLPVLNNSIAHAKGTSTPDQAGNTFLFAHSSDNPFSITRYNTAFYLLDKLKPGDLIQVYYQGTAYTYAVERLEVVKPWQVSALTEVTEHQLTLQTCTPAGTAINRLLVIAKPVDE